MEGTSSLGRLGLLIHATAGFVDPGGDVARILAAIKRNGVELE